MSDKPLHPGQRPKDWVPPEGSPKKKGLPVIAWVGIGLAGLIGLGMLAPKDQAGQQAATSAGSAGSAQAEAAPTAIRVSARELFAQFAANEVAAKAIYDGKGATVTGRLQSIDLDFMDNPVLAFETGDTYRTAQASFTKADAGRIGALAKGMTVTVTCAKVSEVIGSPMLSDCVLGTPAP